MHVWGAKETYTVAGLQSHDQARLVEGVLGRVPGITRVQADPIRHTVSVVYQIGQLPPGSIESAIRRMGFTDVRRA